MTLSELRYVVALAEERNFRRAAQRCYVSQPTLSVAVKKLEEELGVALFERSKGGVQVTSLGEKVVFKARRVLEETAEIAQIGSHNRDQLSEPLALGTSADIGPYLLPQCVAFLQKSPSKTPLYVEEAEISSLSKKLRSGDLDVLIVNLPFKEADVVVQPLFAEPFVALVPTRHRLASQALIDPRDLNPAEVLLLAVGHPLRDQVLSFLPALQAAGAAADTAKAQGTSLETLRHMAASGLGIAVVPLSAAETPFYSSQWLTTRRFTEPAPSRTLALAWRASFPRPKVIDVLRKALQSGSAAYWNYSTGRDNSALVALMENKDW